MLLPYFWSSGKGSDPLTDGNKLSEEDRAMRKAEGNEALRYKIKTPYSKKP